MADHSSEKLSPRAERTRSALIAAGFDLLVERPIDGIAIDELVARAGVAKGSFFNHFHDKKDFAKAIGAEVRCELESLVALANAGIDDPVMRLVGGMRVSAQFATSQPKRSAVLLRGLGGATAPDHPVNKGLLTDVLEACDRGDLLPEARGSGVTYWLGLCQVLMAKLAAAKPDRRAAAETTTQMIVLGLCGLGVPVDKARQCATAKFGK